MMEHDITSLIRPNVISKRTLKIATMRLEKVILHAKKTNSQFCVDVHV